MHKELTLTLAPKKAGNPAARRIAAAAKLRIAPEKITGLRLIKQSIDARKHPVRMQLRVEAWWDEPFPIPVPPAVDATRFPPISSHAPRVLIVGCGPAGMFAALECLRLGMRPVILERGKDASRRRYDLRPALMDGHIVEDSNYCFGEGGAGTFSDGKLYTRATKRGNVRDIYETFVAHGAPEEILTDAHPHIGSNRLPNVVKAMRATIRDRGGEVHFNTRVTDILVENGQACGLRTADAQEWSGQAVMLATGHSARDIHHMLLRHGVGLEAKAFAVGVRIEHPQALVDSVQYHLRHDTPRPDALPAARYQLACELDGRGVHSFCMCPGGFIVPTATSNDEVVVNGMSLSRRDSPFANSGLVVAVHPEDTTAFTEEHGPLAGVAFQASMEKAAKEHGGGGQSAPAQRVVDFLARRESSDLLATSYKPGIRAARLDEILPQGIASRLARAIRRFNRRLPGYAGETGQMIGFETRTSSPVRVPRNPESLESPSLQALFPCGEGAGYAGGIVSAALDGIRVAHAMAAKVKK